MTTTDAGAAPTVVLLHSLGTDRSIWDEERAVLDDAGYRVLTPECRGHGDAPWTPGVTFDAWVADLHAVLERAAEEPVHLVGLTMGGMHAIAYAARHPEMVRSLVVAGTFARLDPEVRDARLAGVRSDIARLGMTAFGEEYVEQTLEAGASQAQRRVVADAIAKASPEGYVATAEQCFGADLTPLLPQVRVPTLVIAGELDRKTPLASSYEVAEGIPGARLVVIEGAGHLTNIDAPSAFDAHLLAFLHDVEGGERAIHSSSERKQGRGVDRRA